MSKLALVPEGNAEIVEVQGVHAVLHSDRAYPPGAPLSANLVSTGQSVQVKITGCKKLDERFVLRGRFVSLSKTTRDQILAELSPSPSKE
ncbi:MAG: hypothetical protein SFV15_21370 [Polyangiaceae bacterium]|nr:hypothetical protein [Polyangiaceae bacterium]